MDKVEVVNEQEEEFNSEDIDNVFVEDLYDDKDGNNQEDGADDYLDDNADGFAIAPDNDKASKKYKNEPREDDFNSTKSSNNMINKN